MTTTQNTTKQYDIGMIGLGVMGRNLLLNMFDHGYSVAGYDLNKDQVDFLRQENNPKIFASYDLAEFVKSLHPPRGIILLVPAGKPVDDVIQSLIPHLEKNDLIIDAGNSHFTDTDRRIQYLKGQDIQFLGVGISGGEEGARRGPSIMPGGDEKAYDRVKPIFEAIAAKVNDEPCVAYLGAGSAGHYVKMVHNGIEYGIMQLIAETYDMLKRCVNLDNLQLSKLYHDWNETESNSYLLEITADIFQKIDDNSQDFLIDKIVDVARQMGTGMWTSESALQLQMPVPTIDAAVTMRDLSVLTELRQKASKLYDRPIPQLKMDSSLFSTQLQHAYYVGMIITYAQGMSLLSVASEKYAYHLNLESVAKIWRGGCIIRAKLLDVISEAYRNNNQLPSLLLDNNVAALIKKREEYFRQIISHAAHFGISSPCFMASLSYFDAIRSQGSPANLIQAQRDYFGSHQYERKDRAGLFHTDWGKINEK